jgi:cytochrome c553
VRAARRIAGAAAVVAAAVVGLLLGGPASAADPTAEALAEQRCAACHGADGRSQTPGVPSLAGMPAEFVTLQMILFREGLRDAPPMTEVSRGLEDREIEALAAWYAGLPAGRPDLTGPPPDPSKEEAGRLLSERLRCGVCHLPDYRGRAQMPRLAAQREDYLVHALTQYRDNSRVGTDTQMNGVMYGLSDTDIAALAHYLAHRP